MLLLFQMRMTFPRPRLAFSRSLLALRKAHTVLQINFFAMYLDKLFKLLLRIKYHCLLTPRGKTYFYFFAEFSDLQTWTKSIPRMAQKRAEKGKKSNLRRQTQFSISVLRASPLFSNAPPSLRTKYYYLLVPGTARVVAVVIF